MEVVHASSVSGFNKTHSTNCDEGDASDGPKGQEALSAASAPLKWVWCKSIRQGTA